jgi:hypothetical protein
MAHFDKWFKNWIKNSIKKRVQFFLLTLQCIFASSAVLLAFGGGSEVCAE